LRLIASSDGREGSVTINQDARVYAGILNADQKIDYQLEPNRYAWLQIARGTVELNQTEMIQGDGTAVSGENNLRIIAHDQAELLLFDLA
jgi:hypothetical protein